LPDPIARSFESLRNQLNVLGERIIRLEGQVSENKEFTKIKEDLNKSSDRKAL
jgi:hypothetical protein